MKYKKRGGKILTVRVLRERRALAQAQAQEEAEAEAQRRAAVRAETERRAAEWRSRQGSPQNDEGRARAVLIRDILVRQEARRAAREAEEAASAPYGGTRKYKHKRTRARKTCARRTCARTRRAK